MKTEIVLEHTICPDLLSPASVMLDLGANNGSFANAIATRFQCRVFAVEASPQVFATIASGDLVKKYNFAICAESGPVVLNISANSEATSLKRLNNWEYVDKVTVPGITLDEFIKTAALPKIDLLKVDIEGAEIEVLNSCSDTFLKSVDQITVEFHEWVGVSTRADVERIVGRLKHLGFFVFKLSRKNFANVLFVNRRRLSLPGYVSTLACIWVPRMFRYVWRHRPIKSQNPRTGDLCV